jgi:hypothetical protein
MRCKKSILLLLNNTPVRWVSKCPKIVGNSNYSSEIAASRIATELILEVRYMFITLSLDLNGPRLKLGENLSAD